eukprot:c25322_g1_i3 orf=442-3090(+)
MITTGKENNCTTKRQSGESSSRSFFSGSSSSNPNDTDFFWQRSVKRKCSPVALDEAQAIRLQNGGGTACVVALEGHRKEPAFMHTQPPPKPADVSRDVSVLGSSCQFQQQADSSSLWLNFLEGSEGSTKRFNNSVPQEPGINVGKAYPLKLATEVGDTVDIDWQIRHKKKPFRHVYGYSSVDKGNSFESKSLVGREELGNLQNNIQTLNRDKSASCSANEKEGASEKEVAALREALRAEKEALCALYIDLDAERNASAIAAEEAMNMIARLQEEKAAVQMEARQYKRLAEERKAHDQETITLLKDILMQREEGIVTLENELEAYRQVFQRMDLEGWEAETCQRQFLEGNAGGTHFLEGKEEKPIVCFEDYNGWTRFCQDKDGKIRASAVKSNRTEEIAYHNSERIDQQSVTGFTCPVFDSMGKRTLDELGSARNGWEEQPCTSEWSLESLYANASFDQELHSSSQNQSLLTSDLGKRAAVATCRDNPGDNLRETKFKGVRAVEDVHTYQDQKHSEWTSRTSGITKNADSPKQKKVSMRGRLATSTEESDWSVRKCVRRLEEQLQHFGEQCECPKERLNEMPSISQECYVEEASHVMDLVGTARTHLDPVVECKHEHIQSFNHDAMGSLGCLYGDEREERFQKIQSTGRLHKSAFHGDTPAESSERDQCMLQKDSQSTSLSTSRKHSSSKYIESEASCDQREVDPIEGIHDIYEVTHDLKTSGRSTSGQSVEERGECLEKLNSQGNVLWEVSEDNSQNMHGEKVANPADLGMDKIWLSVADRSTADSEHNPAQALLDERSDMPREEFQWLSMRLQALESERIYMKQAIESLRKENGELKLLQEIAQQLRELKGTVKGSEKRHFVFCWLAMHCKSSSCQVYIFV